MNSLYELTETYFEAKNLIKEIKTQIKNCIPDHPHTINHIDDYRKCHWFILENRFVWFDAETVTAEVIKLGSRVYSSSMDMIKIEANDGNNLIIVEREVLYLFDKTKEYHDAEMIALYKERWL